MTIVREAMRGDEAAVEPVTTSAIATLRQTYRRLVAVSGNEIVGTVEYGLDGGQLHLIGLNVIASHRRHGVARCLVDALGSGSWNDHLKKQRAGIRTEHARRRTHEKTVGFTTIRDDQGRLPADNGLSIASSLALACASWRRLAAG